MIFSPLWHGRLALIFEKKNTSEAPLPLVWNNPVR
jgi:hypothetical protein